jgi:ABC-2 type transport system ATP-binding protein
MAILQVTEVSKHFVVERPLHKQLLAPLAGQQEIAALKQISFTVGAGEILGVVGPNGAGKTTLLRILADLLEPDGGSVVVCGHRLGKGQHHLRSKIGYVSSDERSFFWRLTGRQNLEFFCSLYGLSRSEARRRIGPLLDGFELQDKAGQMFRDYSSGMRKKFSLIRAAMHEPTLLLLDEVTNSLDPPSAQTVKSFVREYISERGSRVGVWSTHRLEEIAEVCDKVLMIDRGTIWFHGPAEQFQNGKTGFANSQVDSAGPSGKNGVFGAARSEAINRE